MSPDETKRVQHRDAGRIKPPHNCTLYDGSIGLESPALTFDVPAQAILLCSNKCAIIVVNGTYYHASYVMDHLRALSG